MRARPRSALPPPFGSGKPVPQTFGGATRIVMRWGEMVAGLARTATLLNATLLAGSTVAATTYAILQDFPEAGGTYDHRAV